MIYVNEPTYANEASRSTIYDFCYEMSIQSSTVKHGMNLICNIKVGSVILLVSRRFQPFFPIITEIPDFSRKT